MKIKFVFSIITLLSINFIYPDYSFAEEFKLKHADSLEASKEQISVAGNILINYNDTVIEAPKGIIETDNKGNPIKAIFSGKVKLKAENRLLQADEITISIDSKIIYANGNVISEFKDKENNPITISSDYQELHWDGENTSARGNLSTKYKETTVDSDEALFIYKNKKPNEAIFYGINSLASVKQPNNHTTAKSITFNLETQDIHASGNVSTIIWPDETKSNLEQDPVLLKTEELYIENGQGRITALNSQDKVKLTYQETEGESTKTLLLKDSKKPDKIIFIGKAKVSQPDKELISEEVTFNFKDKKLTSNTKTNIRPKTFIYKNKP